MHIVRALHRQLGLQDRTFKQCLAALCEHDCSKSDSKCCLGATAKSARGCKEAQQRLGAGAVGRQSRRHHCRHRCPLRSHRCRAHCAAWHCLKQLAICLTDLPRNLHQLLQAPPVCEKNVAIVHVKSRFLREGGQWLCVDGEDAITADSVSCWSNVQMCLCPVRLLCVQGMHDGSLYMKSGLNIVVSCASRWTGCTCHSSWDRRSDQFGGRWRCGGCRRDRLPGNDSWRGHGDVQHGRGRWQLRWRPHGAQNW